MHELKLDGYRLLARCEEGRVRLFTRRGHDWTDRFPTIRAALEAGGARGRDDGLDGTVLDGEVVVLRRDGTTDFQALQNALGPGGGGRRLTFFAFDLPYYRGHDLTRLPLLRRKQVLRELLEGSLSGDPLRYSDHIVGQGPAVWERACRHGLEGVVSKRAEAAYREGRGRSWVKAKCLKRQEFVVGGWTDPEGSRAHFGALLLGRYDEEGRLRYAGRVGTGFTGRSLEELGPRLEELVVAESPFADPPEGREARGVHWTKPVLVAEVKFGSWTEEGVIRHSSFQGLREDEDPGKVTREMPSDVSKSGGKARGPVRVAGVRLTNPDRVLYPEQGLTKRDLARYYAHVGDRILPHLVGRPLTLVRCPRGREGQCFYQKHLMEGMPAAIRAVEVEEKGEPAFYVGVEDLEGLVSLIQFGVLELHPWGSRADRLDRPDRLVFDLDPGEGVGWPRIVEAAGALGARLRELGLDTFVRTTGGKGLHVVVPLARRVEWDVVKQFARDLARGFERREPERFVATSSKARRKGKIFVDYLRNDRGATAVASYSTRARAHAPVATPLTWDELPDLPRPDLYNVSNLAARLESLKGDPWDGFFESRQSITKKMREGASE